MESDTETEDMGGTPPPMTIRSQQFPVRTFAYHFDGGGSYQAKHWDLDLGRQTGHPQFDWYHVELPKTDQRPSISAQSLITVLCPPLKLRDILTLATSGPFCGSINGALFFRVNSSGPATSDFALRMAARVTEGSVITVSLGRVPRLGSSLAGRREKSLLSEVPRVAEEQGGNGSGVVIGESLLESLLAMNHSEEADHPVPKRVPDLLLHIVDTHVDQVQDVVTRLEMELDSVELELDRGGSMFRKQMLDDRRFPKMHLNLQRLLQVMHIIT